MIQTILRGKYDIGSFSIISGECRDTATGTVENFALEIDADEISYQFMK